MAGAIRLVTKNTFLHVEGEDTAESLVRFPRRSHSMPALRELASTWLATESSLTKRAVLVAPREGEDSISTSASSSSPRSLRSSLEHTESESFSELVDGRTTVMLKHLPNNYTREMLMELLDKEGFAGQYDFIYLPIDFWRNAGMGYAFVNLVDPVLVPRFWKTFDGFKDWVLPTAKVCEMGWSSPLQGLEANVERYRNSPIMHKCVPEEYQPLILANGKKVEFPKPTKSLRPPYRHY